jgi:hypothetical protein
MVADAPLLLVAFNKTASRTHSQNKTVAARQIAEKKTVGHLLSRVTTRLQSLSLPNMISIEALRALIEKVVLTPGPNRGEIDAMLYGELGTILNWIERQAIGKAEKRNTPGALLTGVSVSDGCGGRI